MDDRYVGAGYVQGSLTRGLPENPKKATDHMYAATLRNFSSQGPLDRGEFWKKKVS